VAGLWLADSLMAGDSGQFRHLVIGGNGIADEAEIWLGVFIYNVLRYITCSVTIIRDS